MEFKDFKPEELIGKLVLYESGSVFRKTIKSICKIVKVTKTGFRVNEEGSEEYLFDFNGERKGLHGKMDMGVICRCTLITADQAEELRNVWKIAREMKTIRTFISEHLPMLNFEKLKAIKLLIENK